VRGRSISPMGIACSWSQLYRWFPSVLKAITIIRPETLVRWHRAGFRRYWRWKSRSLGGRPKIGAVNPLSGAPRIHGELLKLAPVRAHVPRQLEPAQLRGVEGGTHLQVILLLGQNVSDKDSELSRGGDRSDVLAATRSDA